MGDLLTGTGNALVNAAMKIWDETVRVIPGIVGALIIILVGVIIGRIVKEIVVRVLQGAKLDEWVEEHKLKAAIGNMHLSVIIGSFIKWYVIVLFLAQAVDLINMKVLKGFAEMLVYYIPLVLGALVIFIGGLLIARFARNMIEALQHRYKKTVAVIVEVVIIYIAAIMALRTVGINVSVLEDVFKIAFTAVVLGAAIIFGIAFGLAFLKDAKQIVAEIKRETEK